MRTDHGSVRPTAMSEPLDVRAPAGPGVLGLVLRLCETLAEADIRYCHWKSNEAIDRSASGENDLDLLVERSHVEAFERVLGVLGFRQALAPPARRFPGIRDFFGLDASSGRLIHVHAHYELVLGHDATKNVRLPIEEAYLASVRTRNASPFPLPSPEFEYVVFVLRMVLKHTTVDAVLGGQGHLPASARRELAYLVQQSDPALVRSILELHLPRITPSDFDRAARALADGSPLSRIRAARSVRGALAACGRRSPVADTAARVAGRLTWNARRLMLPRTTKKRLQGGGAIVAVLGSDGSGKTTALDGLERWLAEFLRTERVHLGKPRKSVASLAVRGLQRAAWRPVDRDRLWELRHVLIARDRAHAYQRAAHVASRGGIVLCDRFPTPVLHRMDAPVLGDGRSSALARRERAYYARIAPPDALVVLDVSPDVARTRRSSDDPVDIAERAEAVRSAAWDSVGAVVLDGERSRDDVLAAMKAAVWERLG